MPNATVGLIPIPLGLDLCGSYADQQLFIQLVNINLGYIVKLLKDVANINITIPGVPAWQITIPGITLPGFQSQPIGYGNTRPDLQDGWIGGRFPMGHPPEPVFGQGKLPGLDDFTVGGQTINIPGTDPYTVTMQIINYNIELILIQVPQLQNIIETIPVMVYSPCTNHTAGGRLTPPGVQANVQQQIQATNEALAQIIKGIGGGHCPSLLAYDDLTLWTPSSTFAPAPNGGTTVLTPTTTSLRFTGTAGTVTIPEPFPPQFAGPPTFRFRSTATVSLGITIPQTFFVTCHTLKFEFDAHVEMFTFTHTSIATLAAAGITVLVNGSAIGGVGVSAVGSNTLHNNFNYIVPPATDVVIEIDISGDVANAVFDAETATSMTFEANLSNLVLKLTP